ncbi:unnamed protein product [Umbelopsis vinacea]
MTIVSVSENLKDAPQVLQLAAQSDGLILAGVGLHPVQCTSLDNESVERSVTMDDLREFLPFLQKCIENRQICCVGEVGLDFSPHIVRGKDMPEEHYRDVQRQVFRQQIELAIEADLPLNVHSRSAGHYAIEELQKAKAKRAVLHAFDGKASHALKGVESGYYFSIPPSIVRSPQKQKLVASLPLSNLLLETDSPALGPNKDEDNQPSNACISAEEIARIKGEHVSEVIRITGENAYKLFGNALKVKQLVMLLAPENGVSEVLRIQAATILGSFAHGNDEIVAQIVAAGAIPQLLNALALPANTSPVIAVQQNLKMLEAATRALKAIYSSSKSHKKDIYNNNHLDNIMVILNVTSAAVGEEAGQVSQIASMVMIAELTTAIVARCCMTHEEQTVLSQYGIITPLVALLHSGYAKAQEAALDAFSSLCRENIDIARASLNARAPFGQMTLTTMLDLVRDKSQSMRLAAATCLTNIYRADVFPEPFSDIVLVVLPTLIKLLKEDNIQVQERAPLIMADLVKDSETMQKAAYEADAIPNLANILAAVSKEDDDSGGEHKLGVQGSGGIVVSKEKVKENSLIALAAVCLLREECRTQAINSKILPYAVGAMSSHNSAIRLAACQCIKSLSRSVRHLRTHLVDAGVISPLLKLLNDDSPVVQAAACGSLCNMILDFSPMKKTVIEEGGLASFVKFTHSENTALKLNAVWSLKNLLYSADTETKRTVMEQLGYEYLIELLNDPSLEIQEQALDLVRNLACGTKEDIDDVFNGIGETKLLDILEGRLTNSMVIDDGGDDSSLTLEPALYTLVNIAVGTSQHKSALLKRPELLQNVVRHMSHEKASVRRSTAWCIINLTWSDSEDKVLPECFGILKDLGVEEKLRVMENDPERDVRDRARTALSQLTSLSDMQEE